MVQKKREEHEATRAQFTGWCVACARGQGIAMKHHRSAHGSDEARARTFCDGLLFPITRHHGADHRGDQDKSDQHFQCF